jgi:hypothetical protein
MSRYYTMVELEMLRECSPHFLTRPLIEQGPRYEQTEHGAMTQLAYKAYRNEARRQKTRGRRGKTDSKA